ncbi:hypothetical protein TBLA_0F00880 [Henningerozyma blattae CBS 6284]|uniref:tRNA-5-taurinomethyluridine 2-sulfurtransferase n=1 Tax=Henningerozyma blattae (strain ATCC 34711 / CBS 6284 / DSM 70876 / NBRC 10599 / NRRL Y-10934 / UCD 77-7) TaxID=1071380 RepID=I2H5I0_HENB6|nr:hypothetical protein TBLA_0F00880 [Tetrapisispora blattae CBS 6284]CCH61632.1 hypothetical protein TBLA_0F00880 [Tetrapisispora blattae CBS 6284]
MASWSTKCLETIGKRTLDGYKAQRIPSKFDNVVVAVSGGVDSALAASLYSTIYPNTRAIYMQNWSKSQSLSDPREEPCYNRDWREAVKVAEFLGIPMEKVNFESDYWIDVFEPMLNSYKMGITPNPDIGCNRFIKFGRLTEYLDNKYGQDNYWLVTGHYSRVLDYIGGKSERSLHLLKSYYKQKDQSYFLSQINPIALRRLLLPVGHLTKPEVREYARQLGLPNSSRPDSQGICFVNNSQTGKFKNFLKHYLDNNPGDIITIDKSTNKKKVWGKHQGIWSYTIGQKVGISMPQSDPQYKGTWFVSDKIIDKNEIVIVKGNNNPELYHDTLKVQSFKPLIVGFTKEWFETECSKGTLKMQYRSLQDPVPIKFATIHSSPSDDSYQPYSIQLTLSHAQRAIAPGQYCCIYWNQAVLGSGAITSVL